MNVIELLILIVTLLLFIAAAFVPDSRFRGVHLGWAGMIGLTLLLVVV